MQNFPTLAYSGDTRTTVIISLNSKPNSSFVIEVFANKNINSPKPAQGEIFISKIDNVRTDASGNASFPFLVPSSYSAMGLTATATDVAGNTSEFSNVLLPPTPYRSSFWDNIGRAVGSFVKMVLRDLGLRNKPVPARPTP